MSDIKNLTEQEYRALPIESFSSLKALLSSLQEFKYFKENPFKGNQSTLLGTALHHYLQGNQQLVLVNDINRTTIAGKESYAKLLESATIDHVILTKTQSIVLDKMYQNFLTNQKCVDILKGCEFEVPHLYSIEIDGSIIQVKGKVDAVNVEEGYIVEIKTSGAFSNIEEFREGSKQMHYDFQAALYCVIMEDLYKKPFKHYFIVANTKEPYNVERYKTGAKYLNDGMVKARKAITIYKKHIIDGLPEEEIEEEL